MVVKILINTLIYFTTVHIILCVPTSIKSRQEDAEAAFTEYVTYSNQILGNLSIHITSLETTQNQLLEAQQITTIDALNKKLDDVSSRISEIEENLKLVGIAECTGGYIDNIEAQRTRLTNRAQKCTQLTSSIISTLVENSHSEMSLWENSLMGCYARSLGECKGYATDDSCYDFFIDNLAKATETMVTDFRLIQINFDNKIAGLKLPCQDLIEFEISVYPDYNLQTISTCADNSIRISRPSTCPQSL